MDRLKKFRVYVGLLVVGLSLPLVSAAQVTVSTVIMTFQAKGRPVQNVMVGNSADGPVYVSASVEKVLDPATGGRNSEPSDNILVSPKAFSIEPRGNRAVRLLIRKPPTTGEEVYRVVFTPQDREFGTEIKKTVGGRTASIRVLTGMGVLAFVEPPNPKGNLEWERRDDLITFTNSGNVHVELGEGTACKGDSCSSVKRKRVYAGTTYEVPVPGDTTVSFVARTGSAGVYENFVIEPLRADNSRGAFSPGTGGGKKKS